MPMCIKLWNCETFQLLDCKYDHRIKVESLQIMEINPNAWLKIHNKLFIGSFAIIFTDLCCVQQFPVINI